MYIKLLVTMLMVYHVLIYQKQYPTLPRENEIHQQHLLHAIYAINIAIIQYHNAPILSTPISYIKRKV